MVASGKKDRMSQEELQQRMEASKTYGVYAIRDRGEDAMTPVQKSKHAELQEQLGTRAGVIEALQDQAVNTIMLAQVAQSYCIERHRIGVPLDSISLLRALRAFWNSAGRALKNYLDTLPDEKDILDIGETIAKAVKEHKSAT